MAPGGVTTTFDYDPDYGYRNKIIDPSAGTMTFSESYAGNLLTTTQTDANNKTITTKLDKYGRPTRKEQAEFNTDYAYDPTTHTLKSETSSNGTSCAYTYDGMGRVATQKEVAGDGVWMQRAFSYTKGSVSAIAYSSSKEAAICKENMYYANGYLTEVKLGTTSIWKLTAENALGQPTTAVTGSLTRTYGYTPYGIPTERKVGSVQHFAYAFDVAKNNLTSRIDKKRTLTEAFGYDNLNRLTSYGGKSTAYDGKGNITSMGGIGSMAYAQASKPYAVTGVTLAGSQIPVRAQAVTYTSFQRPATITENGYVAAFTYNASGSRTKMKLDSNGATQNTTYYIGGCYETNNTESRLYLAGDYYSSPIVYAKKSGSWGIYYICRDYLGSITHVTNSAGVVQQELSYDAWGRLRNPVNQTLYTPGTEPTLFLGRGYTGHEHLAIFGLINMNARLYDPALGRFLSPDPYVQMIDFTQNFNRYSYCLNNPLVYVDENGEFILGFVSGFIRGLITGKNPFKTGWKGAVNEVKITLGLFKGKFLQILSRFTWELPQTLAGYTWSHASNYAGQVDDVGYWGGATVTSGHNWGNTAVTLGSYIVGNRSIAANPNNSLFQHEYGHYLQSQSMGWGYLSRIGIPSLMSADGSGNHKYQPHEQDANRRAFLYFNENVSGSYQTEGEYFKNEENDIRLGWDFYDNPLDVSGVGGRSLGKYSDYNDPNHRDMLNNLTLKAAWYDFAAWVIPGVGTIGVGIGNGVSKKKQYVK